MEYAYTDVDGENGILLSGRFTYEDSGKFHELLEDWDFTAKPSVAIDGRYLTFVDSTAIGMLFLLANRCRDAGGSVTLVNIQPGMQHTLRRVSLDQYVFMK